MTTDTDIDTTQEQPSPNGTGLEPPDYVETEDEAELRALIEGLDDTYEVLLDIPEWKKRGPDGKERVVQVLVRALTAEERLDYAKLSQQSQFDMKKLFPELAILSARHPKTKKLIWPSAADRASLLKKHGMAIERIATLAMSISGLSNSSMAGIRKN